MPRFSIIIPVYNSQKYLTKCLNSVFNQSFNDYEVIVINDGSTDGSLNILNKFKDKIKIINFNDKKTIGPGFARNVGVNESVGDYILFLDSDDYYEINLLKKINDSIDDNYDLVRFQIQYDIDGSNKNIYGCNSDIIFDSGIDAFNEICKYSIVESPCCYAFNRKYFIKQKFKFLEDSLHEDFGLIPLTIIKAKKIKSINYIGYNYVVHENSIMTTNNYDKILKKANDFLTHYKFLVKESKKVSGDLSVFNSYIANSVILKSTTLSGSDYKKYVSELKSLGVFDMLLDDTFGRRIKKLLIKISPKIYYRIVRR